MSYSKEDSLSHFGVLGMKWGITDGKKTPVYIKKATESRIAKLKDGSTLTLSGNKTPLIAKFLAQVNSKVRKNVNDSSFYTLKNPSGKKVGEMELYQESPSSLNVVWVGVKDSQRGNGYASAAMASAISYAKSKKLKTVTLEVPGNAPDAQHIYEKMGFKVVDSQASRNPNDLWGGLTDMRLDLTKQKTLSHSQERRTMTNFEPYSENNLAHWGVLGMKWGITDGKKTPASARKPKAPSSADANAVKDLRSKPTRTLSNDELRTLNNRMQLETTYSELKSKRGAMASVKKGNDTVKTLLAVGGTVATIYGYKNLAQLVKSPGGQTAVNTGKKVLLSLVRRKVPIG